MEEEIYAMQKWDDKDIAEELSRPAYPEDRFHYMVLCEAVRRILTKD